MEEDEVFSGTGVERRQAETIKVASQACCKMSPGETEAEPSYKARPSCNAVPSWREVTEAEIQQDLPSIDVEAEVSSIAYVDPYPYACETDMEAEEEEERAEADQEEEEEKAKASKAPMMEAGEEGGENDEEAEELYDTTADWENLRQKLVLMQVTTHAMLLPYNPWPAMLREGEGTSGGLPNSFLAMDGALRRLVWRQERPSWDDQFEELFGGFAIRRAGLAGEAAAPEKSEELLGGPAREGFATARSCAEPAAEPAIGALAPGEIAAAEEEIAAAVAEEEELEQRCLEAVQAKRKWSSQSSETDEVAVHRCSTESTFWDGEVGHSSGRSTPVGTMELGTMELLEEEPEGPLDIEECAITINGEATLEVRVPEERAASEVLVSSTPEAPERTKETPRISLAGLRSLCASQKSRVSDVSSKSSLGLSVHQELFRAREDALCVGTYRGPTVTSPNDSKGCRAFLDRDVGHNYFIQEAALLKFVELYGTLRPRTRVQGRLLWDHDMGTWTVSHLHPALF